MLNSPVNFNDPTGHESVCGQANSDPECGDLGHTSLSHPKNPTKPVVEPHGMGEDDSINPYVVPLPKAIINTLVSQGADAEMLADVIINTDSADLYWRLSCAGSFNKNVIARTNASNIYWCMSEYFNPDVSTPVLLHELIHVAQYGKYPDDVKKELRRNFIFDVRDMIGGLLDENWQDYNPYEFSWLEVQGANCQIAFANDSSIRLDTPPCNIWIALP